MAPHWPEEVDVFSVPHSRMKKLVQDYKNLVSLTDFRNEYHMASLLQNLINVFSEFKAHEQIENMLIMKKLRLKLNAASVNCEAVCNCHSDNRLTDMFDLVVAGFSMTQKPAKERQAYGCKLQEALEDFTENFIPHMEEEEEVFQPMLIKYFSYDELKELKASVIREHSISKQKEEYCHEKCVEELSQNDESAEDTKDCHIDSIIDYQFPPEIYRKIFKFLNPLELSRASQVCTSWNDMALDASLWQSIYPVQWARGNWTFYPEPLGGVDGLGDQLNDGIKFSDELDGDFTCTLDEDADIDVLDEDEDKDNDSYSEVKRNEVLKEARMLTGMVKSLLSRIGPGVKTIDLAYSKGISSSLLHKILKVCKNVDVLDVSHTRVGDAAFVESGLMQSKLRHLDLTGCQSITDQTLFSLARSRLKNFQRFDVNDGEYATDSFKEKNNDELEIENVPPSCGEKRNTCCGGLYKNNSRDGLQDNPQSFCSSSQDIYENSCDKGFSSDKVKCDNKQYERISLCCSSNLVFGEQERQSSVTTTACRDDPSDLHNAEKETKRSSYATATSQKSCCLPGLSCSGKEQARPFIVSRHGSSSTCGSSSSESECCSKTDKSFCEGCERDVFCPPVPVSFFNKISACDEFNCDCSDSCLSPDLSLEHSDYCQERDVTEHHTDDWTCSSDYGDDANHKEVQAGADWGKSSHTSQSLSSPLEFLSLNGCYNVSDDGLISLAEGVGTPSLRHLDLSGCMGVTGYGIARLVSTCRNLSHSNLFYCDHIPDDPFPTTACGCRNLESVSRFCCTVNNDM